MMLLNLGKFSWVFKSFPDMREDVEGALEEAGRSKRKVTIRYTNRRGELKNYYLSPYSYRTHKGKKYFYGYDLEDGTIKCFLIERIDHVIIARKKFRRTKGRPWEVELGKVLTE